MPSATNQDPDLPFDAARALAQSVSILLSNAGAFALMTVLIHLPTLAVQLYLIAFPSVAVPTQQRELLLLMAAETLLGPLATAAVTFGVLRQIQGNPASARDCLQVGFKRLRHVVGISIITRVLVFLGAILFLAPGLVVATTFFVAMPASVVEGLGIRASFERSRELTRGSRLSILGLLIVLASFLIGLHLIALRFTGDLHAEHLLEAPRFQATSAVIAVFFEALVAVTAAVTYHALRLKRDGIRKVEIPAALD